MDYLSGVVERITFVNEENGFSVVKIKSKGFSDLVTAVGNMASVNVGAVVSLRGSGNTTLSLAGSSMYTITKNQYLPLLPVLKSIWEADLLRE